MAMGWRVRNRNNGRREHNGLGRGIGDRNEKEDERDDNRNNHHVVMPHIGTRQQQVHSHPADPSWLQAFPPAEYNGPRQAPFPHPDLQYQGPTTGAYDPRSFSQPHVQIQEVPNFGGGSESHVIGHQPGMRTHDVQWMPFDLNATVPSHAIEGGIGGGVPGVIGSGEMGVQEWGGYGQLPPAGVWESGQGNQPSVGWPDASISLPVTGPPTFQDFIQAQHQEQQQTPGPPLAPVPQGWQSDMGAPDFPSHLFHYLNSSQHQFPPPSAPPSAPPPPPVGASDFIQPGLGNQGQAVSNPGFATSPTRNDASSNSSFEDQYGITLVPPPAKRGRKPMVKDDAYRERRKKQNRDAQKATRERKHQRIAELERKKKEIETEREALAVEIESLRAENAQVLSRAPFFQQPPGLIGEVPSTTELYQDAVQQQFASSSSSSPPPPSSLVARRSLTSKGFGTEPSRLTAEGVEALILDNLSTSASTSQQLPFDSACPSTLPDKLEPTNGEPNSEETRQFGGRV